MHQLISFFILCLTVLTINAQTVNVRGKVSTQGGARPLPNATLILISKSLTGSSDTSGTYLIQNSNSVKSPLQTPQAAEITLKNGILEFNLSQQKSLKIEIFDIKGTLIKKEFIPNVNAGVYRYDITEKSYATNLLVVHASIGQSEITFRYLPGRNGSMALTSSENSAPISGKLAKITAVSDSLKVTAKGHTPKTIAISSYDTVINIILDSLPGPSAGCGKTFSTLTSGTYKITSAGLNREYIIDVPKNYDPNRPYRLIFGMHCMCGSMWSVHSENFYELKRSADSANIPCIFVAPSVYNSGNYDQNNWGCPVWDQGEKDHTFFDDMLKLFKDTLCVDTTRVFVAGFSFGSMFTNSLAQNHQKQIRAVVCYETANYNIYVPKNTGLPIAWMGVVGLSDGTCPPAAGRACRDTMLKYNGASSSEKATEYQYSDLKHLNHLVYDYKTVNPKYPVRWCTFDGCHQWSEYDGGGCNDYDPNKTWTAGVAWQFIKQF